MQRPDFDQMALFPARHVTAAPAREEQLTELTELAADAIPALSAAEAVIRRVHRHNPDSIWAVRSAAGNVGVFAMLILNRAGLRDLFAGQFDSTDPDLGRLSRRGEDAAAVYFWAIVTPGLAIEAFRVVSRWLQLPPTRSADIFTRPTTEAGLRLSLRIGFKPIPELGLYCFQRQWNRKETTAVA